MNHNYIQVIACVLLSFSGYNVSIAQTSGPEFLDCSSTPISLCVQDEGIRLPSNNQLYLGEEDPNATSCSVHVTQKKRVRSHCGDSLQYEVLLFIHDTSSVYILKSVSTVITDSLGEAELNFNTEEALDELIRTSGLPYGTDCSTPHLIKWVVLDSCGGFSVCEQRIDLYDCSALIAEIPSNIFTAHIPSGCQLSLFAEDFFIGGLDDCSLQDQFVFSFQEHTYVPDSTITCPEAFGVELSWKIWIADEGRDLNCNGQIDWEEKGKIELPFQIVFTEAGNCECGMPIDHTLSGKINTEFGEGIKDVAVTLSSPGQVYPTYVTVGNGNYTFQVQSINGEATISAERDDYHKNGVSTLDLVKIQKHLLGKDTLESPYKIIAADANNSQNVSAIDLVELRKLILGVYTELPANQSWVFVPTAYVFPDPFDPWTDTITPWPHNGRGTITIMDLENPGNLDFIGIKIGDVNGTAQPNFTQLLPRESIPQYELKTDQQLYSEGDIIHVPIRISADQSITGFQYTLNATGMEFIGLLPGAILIGEDHYALFNDQMTVSWFDESDIALFSGDILYTIQLRANEPGDLAHSLSINSSITDAELYVDSEQTYEPQLRIEPLVGHNEFDILSCYPNPWKDETTVSFYLPESDQVSFTLFDVSGREIFSTTVNLKSGQHQYQITSSDFKARGMLLLEIKTAKYSEVMKLIVTE